MPEAQVAPAVAPTFDAASGLWLSDGWPVPDPSAIYDSDAPVRSAAETTQATADCLTARGWTITINGPGEFVADTPPEQVDAYQRDYKACLVEHRIGTEPSPPLSVDLARSEYAAQERTRACLIAEGAAVPELPSYQVFEDTLLGQGAAIGIYGLSLEAGLDITADETLRTACPDPLDTWGQNRG